jgi:hypothetical protein
LKKSLILPRTAEQLLQECVQEVGESGIGVEQACDCAKQVAQKIIRTRHRRDAKMDRCQVLDSPSRSRWIRPISRSRIWQTAAVPTSPAEPGTDAFALALNASYPATETLKRFFEKIFENLRTIYLSSSPLLCPPSR